MINRNRTITNWDELPLFLSVDLVATMLDVNRETVKRWLQNGTLKGFKIGKNWYIARDQFKLFTEARVV